VNKTDFLTPAPQNYEWPRCPEADRFIQNRVQDFLSTHAFARALADKMKTHTSTPFSVWVDHVALPAKGFNETDVRACGFEEDKRVARPKGVRVFAHPFADLPRLTVSARTRKISCAITVEELWRFQAIHGLSLPIEGTPYGLYRVMRLPDGPSELFVIERRGSQTLVPDTRARSDATLRAFELWATRPRRFASTADGMKVVLKLAADTARRLGAGPAAHVFLETERLFWQGRNHAAQIQKARQDSLGLGWANHDHHTFRSSRAHFPLLMKILMTLGFKKRERYFAGADAGWGAQILEQPDAGTVIFADVDLSPEDMAVDFSKIALPELKAPRTIGLWCALHGDSILESGMHHLEAQFDFDQLKSDLGARQVETMPPFSNFPFLRQAFTKAEMWPVPEQRLNALRAAGKLSDEAFATIREKGAVGSHLENLERKDGFKGFNQKGVSHIITAVNPEKQALHRSDKGGA
jgi:hypothetical protein